MAFKFNLKGKVVEFLTQNPDRKFTALEIAEWVFKTYPDECQEKKRRSTATVIPVDSDAALLREIRANIATQRSSLGKKYPKIKTTEERPKKYYYTDSTDSEELERAEGALATPATASGTSTLEAAKKEHDLYPVLADFLWSELEIYSKRIDEKRSGNSRGAGGNEWLYPDLVGMENLSRGWEREIKDCVQQYADKKTRLWSFEVKILINRSNIRKVFFQTVSNSSWANFGYLVASEIGGDDTLKELRILSGLHGIGFIRLDTEDPSESQIMIPARERPDIDWNTANRLAEENKDFLGYIKRVREFYQTGNVRPADWDARPVDD